MKYQFSPTTLLISMLFSIIPASSASGLETGDMRQPLCTLDHQEMTYHPGYNASESFMDVVCKGTMSFYSNALRPVISSGCFCYPSCSEYMAQAIQIHGFPVGVVLGLERLIHEYGEYRYGVIAMTPNGWKIYDPVKNNTFWWRLSRDDHK